MKTRAAITSALLSILFWIVYGTTNYLASLREHVGSFAFAWERHVPFIPMLIVPYFSLDCFFVVAPFLCRDDHELRTLRRRIAAAILIAGACFLLFPLRFSFPRPHVDGWQGAIFNNFRQIDPPFNEFPSLHVALCLILLEFYNRHANRIGRFVLSAWFTLVGGSAVLTYQHHVIDVIGGIALAMLCLHFFHDDSLRQPTTGNPRAGATYLIGSVLLFALAFTNRPATLILLWPAFSTLIVSTAYFGLGPGVFRKQHGVLPWTTNLIFLPVLIGQQISLLWYSLKSEPWGRVTDHLWIGRRLRAPSARRARDAGITAVLDLTAEFSETKPFRDAAYLQIPILDLTSPTPEQLKLAIAWITEQSVCGIVYVHCKVGYSRTAAVAGSFLLASGQAANADEAIAMLRAARPTIIIRPEAEQTLRTSSFPLRPLSPPMLHRPESGQRDEIARDVKIPHPVISRR